MKLQKELEKLRSEFEALRKEANKTQRQLIEKQFRKFSRFPPLVKFHDQVPPGGVIRATTKVA